MSDDVRSKQPSGKGGRDGKSKHKRDSLPYMAKINSDYQKHDFKTCFEKAFLEKQQITHGKSR